MNHGARPSPRSRSLNGHWIAGLFLVFATALCTRAGPPFMTDDPEPVDLNNWEVYVFGQGDRTADENAVSGPALELNYGIARNTQLHLVAPIANTSSPGSGWSSGYGDTEAGIKYRFIDESESFPQVGVFPMAELATASSGLGNGRTWYRVPLWVQKSWGPWTTYGGGGEALNSARGQRDYSFAGWLVQRDLGNFLSLGAELFTQGASSTETRGYTIANIGGTLKFTEKFNLLFSAGHSISGERHTVWYLGLYWTGGPSAEALHRAPGE
jgi:hypothetical protein